MKRFAHDTRAAPNGEPVGEMLEFGTALRHIAAGRSLTRAALTQLIREHVVAAGSVLDLGASSAASYRAILPGTPDGIMSVDVRESAFPDVVADIEREPLPFHDGSFDTRISFLSTPPGFFGPAALFTSGFPFSSAITPTPTTFSDTRIPACGASLRKPGWLTSRLPRSEGVLLLVRL